MESNSVVKVAFWNVGNLFDTEQKYIAMDFQFIPQKGWTEEVKNKKLDNLASVIKSMDFGIEGNENREPDLLGLSEVENKYVLQELIDRLGSDKYIIADYWDGPDLRGIDTCLIYSKDKFDLLETKGFSIDFRYPTRDIFLAKLRVKTNGAEIYILVSHWPSRRGKFEGCQPNDTAHARNAVAESCGKIIDGILKIPKDELFKLPDELNDETIHKLDRLDQEWNKNVLLMGDFNDEPYDESVVKYLGAGPDILNCREWKEIFELRAREERNISDISCRKYYFEENATLFNCMWRLITELSLIEQNASNLTTLQTQIPRGTVYYWRNNRWSIFDQFVISRGLFYGKQKLRFKLDSIKIAYHGIRLVDNLSPDKFEANTPSIYNIDKSRIHPLMEGIPMEFVFLRYYYNQDTGEYKPDNKSIPRGRDPNTGYSDHFPIQCTITAL